MVEGLRTREEPKFYKLFKLVQEAAREKGCMFFLDSGESHELITEELDGEDLGGWLVPFDKVDVFSNECVFFIGANARIIAGGKK